MSRAAIGDLLGLSEEQVAYVESGHVPVKVHLAAALARALDIDLAGLFPDAAQLVGKGKKAKSLQELVEQHYDDKVLREFAHAGIDLDPASWTLNMRLRRGASLSFAVSKWDARRLRNNFQEPYPNTPFFLFNSSRVAAAVNLRHLTHHHELWDGHTEFDWHSEKIPAEDVAVFFADSPDPLTFDVSADEAHGGDEDEIGEIGAIEALLLGLDTLVEPDEVISFMDSDGEYAFFRSSDIALLTIPARVVNPRLNDWLVDIELGLDDASPEYNEEASISPIPSPSA